MPLRWTTAAPKKSWWAALTLALEGIGSQASSGRRVYRLTVRSVDKHGQAQAY
ncbi:MAG: hypothetical protein QMB14_05190 [Polaromonas sp.]|jgi:hypothetical protein